LIATSKGGIYITRMPLWWTIHRKGGIRHYAIREGSVGWMTYCGRILRDPMVCAMPGKGGGTCKNCVGHQ